MSGPGSGKSVGHKRLDTEVERRADVVGIFPNEDNIVRLTMTRGRHPACTTLTDATRVPVR